MLVGTPFFYYLIHLEVFYCRRAPLWSGQQGASVRGNISDSVVDSSHEELSIQHHSVAASPQQAGRSANKSQTAITHSKKRERNLTLNEEGRASKATRHSNVTKCFS